MLCAWNEWLFEVHCYCFVHFHRLVSHFDLVDYSVKLCSCTASNLLVPSLGVGDSNCYLYDR